METHTLAGISADGSSCVASLAASAWAAWAASRRLAMIREASHRSASATSGATGADSFQACSLSVDRGRGSRLSSSDWCMSALAPLSEDR